ncbi:MAG TPA: aldehyde dehydrogenase family protein [Acidimicrobiales bacterium]|nr:aldehyde dehydrogenase family protein [Acidimicrobiales bacterium]
MFVAGEWRGAATVLPVLHPFDGHMVDTVPAASLDDVEQALAAAVQGASTMAATPAHERCRMLLRAADLLESRVEEMARTISAEEGKPLAEARGEATRCGDLIRLAAFEGSQVRGETLPLDASSNGVGKLGMTLRAPCGVVVAISPFNYPLMLVLHKVAPAIAAGNAVILKPATQTPLTALKMTEILLEAGVPALGLQTLTGEGSIIGPALCADRRVRKVSFTGSSEVGRVIAAVAGVKKLSLELGSNCPLVVLPDADLDQVADATATSGYINAGQVCISTQRVLADRAIYADLLDALTPRVASLRTGDPFADDTQLSAMISPAEAQRVTEWVDEAVDGGARLLTGGERIGGLLAPTLLADVAPTMRVSCQELFGPAVAVTPVSGIDEALRVANDSEYGLGSGIFTRSVDAALAFARAAQFGTVNINSTPLWRADLMPYGGLKQSGIGKEGPRYAVEEMTESKTVIFHEQRS